MLPRHRPTRARSTRRTLGTVSAVLLLGAGCSSSSSSSSSSGPASAPAPGAGSTAAPATGAPAAPPSAAAPAAPAAVAPGATLLASVGTEDDPESYEIALTTQDGTPVESLPAGDYTIEVSDRARTHNFALRGPGVEEATSVRDVEQVVLEVTLQAGEYTYVCDPHPSMSGTLQVV